MGLEGFGDSTGKPTPDGVVEDALTVYEWLRARVAPRPIIIYAHSLGTGSVSSSLCLVHQRR